MRLLVVCDVGANRSVTLAHQLKFKGHDVLTAGLGTNEPETLDMLCDWAERVITTDRHHQIAEPYRAKTECWDIGPDRYPRPFNPQLLAIVRKLMAEHEPTLAPEAARSAI